MIEFYTGTGSGGVSDEYKNGLHTLVYKPFLEYGLSAVLTSIARGLGAVNEAQSPLWRAYSIVIFPK